MGCVQALLLVQKTAQFKATSLPGKKAYYRTDESPDVWFEPTEVWEIRGADLTVSPVHKAAAGHIHPDRGISLRFTSELLCKFCVLASGCPTPLAGLVSAACTALTLACDTLYWKKQSYSLAEPCTYIIHDLGSSSDARNRVAAFVQSCTACSFMCFLLCIAGFHALLQYVVIDGLKTPPLQMSS